MGASGAETGAIMNTDGPFFAQPATTARIQQYPAAEGGQGGTAYIQLLLSEIKLVREEARKARGERNQLSQTLDQTQRDLEA